MSSSPSPTPTDMLSTEGSEISTYYLIIGSSALATLVTIISIITAVISYKCGRRIERMQRRPHRERSSTELINNELYEKNKGHSYDNTGEAYIEMTDFSPKSDDDSYSKLQHNNSNKYTGIEITETIYSSLQQKTDMPSTQQVNGTDSMIYTSLNPDTIDNASDYNVTTSSKSTSSPSATTDHRPSSVVAYEQLKDY